MRVYTQKAGVNSWKDDGEQGAVAFKSGDIKVDVACAGPQTVILSVEVDGKIGYRTIVVTPEIISVENS